MFGIATCLKPLNGTFFEAIKGLGLLAALSKSKSFSIALLLNSNLSKPCAPEMNIGSFLTFEDVFHKPFCPASAMFISVADSDDLDMDFLFRPDKSEDESEPSGDVDMSEGFCTPCWLMDIVWALVETGSERETI